MFRRIVDYSDYVNQVIKALPGGALITTRVDDKVNSMVIGWGAVGVNWGKPMFMAFVRESRFTREMLDENPEFTINVPVGAPDKNILRVCGSMSGRDVDKVSEAKLTLTRPEKISVPGIKEFPLTLECRVVYSQKQDPSLLEDEIIERFYPRNIFGTETGPSWDAHITYYGEIVAAYIIED